MKFCSVGAVKYKTERHGCDALQYMFDSTISKPTNAKTFLDILPDVRTISHAVDDATGNLSCAPLAGYKDSKLYLTNVIVPSFSVDNTAQAYLIPATGTKPNLDAFYMFCCVYSKQLVNQNSLVNGNRSMMYEGFTNYAQCLSGVSPIRYPTKTGALGYRMVFYPNSLAGKSATLPTYSDYTLSAAQGLTYDYSYSYYSGGLTYYRTTRYTTYLATNQFTFGGATTISYKGVAQNPGATLPTGANKISWSVNSTPGIQLFRPSRYYYYYDTQYTASGSYQEGDYIASSVTTTESSVLPYLNLAGTDETIDLSFSAIGYRDLEKDNIVIRDFGTDLIQTGSKDPNTFPTVQLVSALDYAPLVSVYNI